MSKFERVLSKSDEQLIIDGLGLNGLLTAVGRKIIQLAEQATLAKLAEQEPIVYLYGDEAYGASSGDINDYIRTNGMPLYAHPIPSKQGILDSSKTVTKENLPPLPEPHCRHGGGIGYFDSYSKEQMIEYAKSAIDHYKAMLTAAPKYTGGSK